MFDETSLHSTLSDGAVSLQQWSTPDAKFLVEACSNPEIRLYNAVPVPYSLVEAEGTIGEFVSKWRTFLATRNPSGVAFKVVDVRSGEPVGLCGIDEWSEVDVAQIGYWLAESSRGNGYATRAVVLLTRWLFALGAARVFMTIVAGNDRSAAVARRAGFAYEGTMRSGAVLQGRRADLMWFAALAQEWQPSSTA